MHDLIRRKIKYANQLYFHLWSMQVVYGGKGLEGYDSYEIVSLSRTVLDSTLF
jgi:hypothetical protein